MTEAKQTQQSLALDRYCTARATTCWSSQEHCETYRTDHNSTPLENVVANGACVSHIDTLGRLVIQLLQLASQALLGLARHVRV